MRWLEPTITEIISTRLYYFDETNKKACNRICEVLNIDILPSCEEAEYYQFNQKNGTWSRGEINAQNVLRDTPIFEKELIGRFGKNPSNILFTTEAGVVKGVLHFTDYAKHPVYHSLYHNFLIFEKSLRKFLEMKNFNQQSFIDYLNVTDNKNYKEKTIKTIKSAEKKGVNFYEKLYLKDLLGFCTSPTHSKCKPLELRGNEDSISRLRNMVMHAHDNTGNKIDVPHNFHEFSDFFAKVLAFKDIFESLKFELAKTETLYLKKVNQAKLKAISDLSDKEISRLFYDESF